MCVKAPYEHKHLFVSPNFRVAAVLILLIVLVTSKIGSCAYLAVTSIDTVLGHARLLHFTLHMSAVHTSVCVCVGMYVCVYV